MPLKKLFLAHYSGDTRELYEQATELRLRGIVPWVDKQGGFSVADESETEARRAITEDCFGLLLYATEHVFDRPFIRNVEIDQACKRRAVDPSFALFAVPRAINFADLQQHSLRSFKIDLSKFHTIPITSDVVVEEGWAHVASDVLRKALQRGAATYGTASLSLQYSTRELLPDEAEDILRIDATSLFLSGTDNEQNWQRLLKALRDVKKQISGVYGRPRLCVHGSKHLTAAFIFGRVFAPFEMDIRQTRDQIWRTDAIIPNVNPFLVSVKQSDLNNRRLFVEIASGYKNIATGVEGLLDKGWPQPSIRLQLRPQTGALAVDNEICRAMVKQTYSELDRMLQTHPVTEIHMFAAVPQAFMMMLGREFKGMPSVHLYEWSDNKYVRSCSVPIGVL